MKSEYLPFLNCGVQCNNLLICNNKIYDIGGFCTGDKVNPRNPRMLRGFKTNINQFDPLTNQWSVVGEIMLSPRMGSISFVHQNEIYIWGGFSYTPLSHKDLKKYKTLPPKDHVMNNADGIKISFINNQIFQTKLPDLPFNHCLGKATVVNDTAYFLGGAYYTAKGYDTQFETDGVSIGKAFYSIDLNHLDQGFNIINNYPGSPIFCHSLIEYNHFLYVIGGKCTTRTDVINKNGIEYRPLAIIDNWKYDTINNQWSRLNSRPPLIIANYTAVRVKHLVFTFGGARYTKTYNLDLDKIVDTDNIYQETGFLQYGKISDIKYPTSFKSGESSFTTGNHSNLIMMYDLIKDEFTILDHRLPVNIVIPTIANQPDHSYFIYFGGGETNRIKFKNREWTTHPYQFMRFDVSQYFD